MYSHLNVQAVCFYMRKKIILGSVILFAVIATAWTFSVGNRSIDYSTEVKPIINKNCISCHGGVKQKGGFSLLFREEALTKTTNGKYGIVPGEPDRSEMIRRINSKDAEERMPYKHDPLSDDEIAILTKWIKQGARWGQNWSYVPVKETAIPQPKTFFGLFTTKSDWAKSPVDNFIEEKLKEQDLHPSPQAEKEVLLRRVSLDIIGMPAPEKIVDNFLKDNSADAYEKLVDALLSSPHYGEKWTAMWLDIARYADSKGYERDSERKIWKYRDWVIDAFNADMPYDKFLTEQIAGDLLPDPTDNNYIATAFHRNTMTNDEGGTDNEEFRTAAVMDRLNTTWQGLMGTTFACVQCHSHPYDPFKHDEYYKFLAFFNDSRDEDTEADYPLLRQYESKDSAELVRLTKWITDNASATKAKEYYTFLKTFQPSYNSLTCDSFTNSELSDTKWLAFRDKAICRLKDVDLSNRTSLIFSHQAYTGGGTWQIHIDEPNGAVIATVPLPKSKGGWAIAEAPITPQKGTHHLYFTYTNPNLKGEQTGVIFDWFYFTNQFPGKDKPGADSSISMFRRLMNAKVTTTPIMFDNPANMHRASHVFERGNWLVKGDVVAPDVPKSLNAFPASAPRNRLGLAMWLTSKENPLTARTMVNRVWEQLFGTGLAETLEDLGSQGITPTHMQLLDWLSYQLMNDYKWSIKKLIKTIVTSAAYQQSSKLTPELQQKDPYNKYYARGARVRLSAEQVRDQSLCISELLNEKMYGPGVFPYQPPGIWLSPWNGEQWKQDSTGNQYRRAVYTYWKRSAPYPSMMMYDGVAREVCTARRIRTNTPLQALTTLNDSAYIDIARHFAYRMKEKTNDPKEQISKGFKLATYKNIDDKSLAALLKLYNMALAQFKNDTDKTCYIMGGINEHTNAATAALTIVANAMLNLDEVVMKN
jgi:mono/diheme cytochrome c family protein